MNKTGTLNINRILRVRPRVFWLHWVLASTIGGAIGWAIAGLIAFGTLSLGVIAIGAIAGISVGWAQGTVLEKHIVIRGTSGSKLDWVPEWTTITCFVGGLGWIVIGAVGNFLLIREITSREDILTSLLAYGTGGAILGVGQALVLKRGFARAWWWVPITALGLYLAAAIGSWLGNLIFRLFYPSYGVGSGVVMGPVDAFFLFCEGTMGTIVFSVVTGLALIWVLGSPLVANPEPPDTPSQPQRIADPS
jgi:hypothetical protein